MARLPSVDDVTRLPVQVGRGVAQYSGAEQQGQSIRAIGQEITQVADQELARLDELRVEEAVNKLREKDTELTIGEKGYVRVKGDAALSKPLIDTYGEQYKRAAADIGTGLTARQRAKFDAAANRGRQQFQAGVLRHTLGEADKRDDEVYKASIVSIQDKASKYAAAGLPTDQLQQELDAVLARRLAGDGIDPSTPDGAKIAGAIRLQEHGKVHSAIIESYIQGDRFTEATEYLKANEKNLTADQYKAVNARLKPLNDIAVGGGFGTQAVDLVKGGGTQAQALSFILKQTEGKPAQQQAAMQRFEIERNAWRADQDNVQGEYFLKYSEKPSLATYRELDIAIRKDSRLTAQEKNQAVEHLAGLRDRDDARRRASAAEARGDGSDKVEDIVRVYELSAREGFYQLTPAQVAAEGRRNGLAAPAIGALVRQNAAGRSAAASFGFDMAALNTAASDIAPNDKNKQNAVKALIQDSLRRWKEENPGKVPSDDQRQKILNAGAVKYRDLSSRWFGTEKERYELDDETLARSVPLDFYNEQIAIAKKTGGKELTEKQILDAYRIQERERDTRVSAASVGVPWETFNEIARQAGGRLSPAQIGSIYRKTQSK